MRKTTRKTRDLEPVLRRLKEEHLPALRSFAVSALPALPALPARRAPRHSAAAALGTAALGALALGALAIGALAVGRLAVRRARVQRLEVDELTVGTLRIRNAVPRDALDVPREPATEMPGHAPEMPPTTADKAPESVVGA